MKLKNILAVLILFLSVNIFAAELISPTSLAIEVSLSDSLEYQKKWVSTPIQEAVPLPRIKALRIGQTGYAAFVVSGLRGDTGGNFSYSVSWSLYDPNGKLVHEIKDYAKGSGRLHNKPAFYMADPALDIILESSDPAGEYVIEAMVVDKIAKKSTKNTRRFNFYK